MKAPQIIYIVITAIGMLITANNHGKPRKNENFWYSLIAVFIGYSLLIWGGFFN